MGSGQQCVRIKAQVTFTNEICKRMYGARREHSLVGSLDNCVVDYDYFSFSTNYMIEGASRERNETENDIHANEQEETRI